MLVARDALSVVLHTQIEVFGIEPSGTNRLRSVANENDKLEQLLKNATSQGNSFKNCDADCEAGRRDSTLLIARSELGEGLQLA